MAINPTSFKIRFNEFDSVLDAYIQLFIDDAMVILNPVFWGSKYDLGLYYLTAHFLSLSNRTNIGASGSFGPVAPVASKSVDGVSISYNNPVINNMSDAIYGSTIYGQRYLALRQTLGVAACVV